ncbi:MAG: AI-2E family transporter [Bacillota bacterium]
MWVKNNFFKYGAMIAVVLTIIFLLGQIDFFIEPFKKFVLILFFPILVSVFLYYIFRPFVRLLRKIKFPDTLAILTVFLTFIGLVALFIVYASSTVGDQIGLLLKDLPTLSGNAIKYVNGIITEQSFYGTIGVKIEQQITSSLQSVIPAVSNGILGALGTLAGVASMLVIVPFILFFMLKDDSILLKKIRSLVKGEYLCEVDRLIKETDKTLSSYIIGQVIIALIIGVLTYIGFTIFGLKYAAILSLFVAITAFIPILGIFIGLVPALIVAITMYATNPYMIIEIIILTIIVQQLVGNLIFPNLIGKQLSIHPLTIILIFLGATALFGFVGMLIIIPLYAVIKILVSGVIKFYKIWKNDKRRKSNDFEMQ